MLLLSLKMVWLNVVVSAPNVLLFLKGTNDCRELWVLFTTSINDNVSNTHLAHMTKIGIKPLSVCTSTHNHCFIATYKNIILKIYLKSLKI